MPATNKLTQKQLDRQDFVDNAISNMIREVALPSTTEKHVPEVDYHDIDLVGEIRELIEEKLEHAGISPLDFYPYFVEEDDVSLIASGYDWWCPGCESFYTITEVKEHVYCKKCRKLYPVTEFNHAT